MIQICMECRATNEDMYLGEFCFGGQTHQWVKATVTDCPFTRRDKNGVFREQWRQQANRQCKDEIHHFGLVVHVTLPEDATSTPTPGAE